MQEKYTGINFSIIAAPMVRDYKEGKQCFTDMCQMLVGYGIRNLDLMEPEVEEYGLAEVKKQMDIYNIRTACFISFISMNIGNKQKIQDRIKRAIEMAKELKSKLLMLVLTPQNEIEQFNKKSKQILITEIEEHLRWAVEEARKYGIKVCIEETPNYELPVCSAKDCLHILNNVPELGLAFDTGNMIPAEDDPFDFYQKTKKFICHVHLKDVMYTEEKSWDKCKDGRYIKGCVYGHGIIPVNELKKRLIEDGFNGCCAIEYVEPKEMGINANKIQLGRMISYLNL